jgi:tRNA-dihydrouridine synthase 1
MSESIEGKASNSTGTQPVNGVKATVDKLDLLKPEKQSEVWLAESKRAAHKALKKQLKDQRAERARANGRAYGNTKLVDPGASRRNAATNFEERAKKLALLPAVIDSYKPPNYAAAWDFYTKTLGGSRHVCAPMVNQSELAFRMLVRRYGCNVCYTPMLHAGNFATMPEYREENFVSCPQDRPLIAQFCGNDPKDVLAAAKFLEGKVDGIDLNFGCPQGIARRGNYGSYLLDKPHVLRALVATLHSNLNIPVTCKVRLLPNEEETLKMVKILQEAGCSILTVHGRTRDMKKEMTGPNNFQMIKRIKDSLSIPVFANGGIETWEDVEKCLKETGVDGVMSSEALLTDPGLFSGPGSNPHVEPIKMAYEYLAAAKEYKADPSAIRSHLFKILHRELFAFVDLRIKVATSRMIHVESVLDELKARNDAMTPEERTALYSKYSTWYRRWDMFGFDVTADDRKDKADKKKFATEEQCDCLSSFLFESASDDTKQESPASPDSSEPILDRKDAVSVGTSSSTASVSSSSIKAPSTLLDKMVVNGTTVPAPLQHEAATTKLPA